MQRKGFTLAELLGVIVIVGLLLLLIIPLIINGVKNKEKEVEETQTNIIYEATSEYMDTDKNKYPNNPGDIYCITVKELKENGKLAEENLNILYGKNYDNATVKVVISNKGIRTYSINDEKCEPYQSEKIKITIEPSNNKWSQTKEVTIHYPESQGTCGVNAICTYKKDNGEEVVVSSNIINGIIFDANGKIEAKIKGKSEINKSAKVEKIDRENPIIVSRTLGAWKYDTNDQKPKQQISIVLTDAHSGVGGYCIKTDTTKPSEDDPCFNNRIVRFPAYGGTGTVSEWLPIGTYYLFAKDRVGNVTEYNPELNFKIEDTTPPSINLSQNTNTTWKKDGRDITLTIKDGESGLNPNQKVYYAWSTSNTAAPSYTSYVTTTNVIGAKETTVTIPASASSKLTGTYYLWIKTGTLSDTAGNLSLQKISGAFNFDNTKPTCTLSSSGTKGSNNWYIGNVTVSSTNTDVGGGISKYYLGTSSNETYNNLCAAVSGRVLSKNCSLTHTSDTKAAAYYGYVIDVAGNKSNCRLSPDVKKDTVKPTISVTTNYNQTQNFSVSLSDSTSGLVGYAITTSTSTPTSWTTISGSSFSKTHDLGEGYYYVYAKDAAGNVTRTTDTYGECLWYNTSWSACSGTCGTGTRYWVDNKTGKYCPGTEATCDLGPCYETVYTCRYQDKNNIYPGDTCLHDYMGWDCSTTTGVGIHAMQVEDAGGDWYYIVGGVGAGKFIQKKCTVHNQGESCSYGTCPG